MTPPPPEPTLIRHEGTDKFHNRLGRFRCSCGNEFVIAATRIKNGYVKSCGCYQKQRLSESHMRHGDSPHGPNGTPREYAIWSGMKTRCYNTKFRWYHRYGGRGIRVCERWHDYVNFVADMGRAPSPKHTIERVNNDGDYCPENCVWATFDVQANNRSNNRKLTVGGVTRSMTEWARSVGLSCACVSARLRHGWSEERAIFTPNTRRVTSQPVHVGVGDMQAQGSTGSY